MNGLVASTMNITSAWRCVGPSTGALAAVLLQLFDVAETG